jgi:hypothetical protein
MTAKAIPTSGPEFEVMMRAIDADLTVQGNDIPSRPSLAVREVSLKHNVSIPKGGRTTRLPPDLAPYVELGNAIRGWYQDVYGDRLKIDFCPGRTVVLLDGDLYTLRVPRIMGSVRFIISRQFIASPDISRGPVTSNIVQLVEEITPNKAAFLSDNALRSLDEAFGTALPAAYTLESTDHELMFIVRGDVATAIAGLMDRGERYGESKWASLQAAEKVMKAAIDLQNAKFKFKHGLKELASQLANLGIRIDGNAAIAAIQCRPGIRYGEEPCSRDEAIAAHRAFLQIVNMLREAGAKFELGLG